MDLRQRDLTVLEYEGRFQDLAAFASIYLPMEHHRVERFRDELRQELSMILIAMQFQSVQDLVRAAQGMERVMRDAQSQWFSKVRRLELRGEILDYRLGDLLSQRKGRVDSHWDSSKGEVGGTPQGVAWRI